MLREKRPIDSTSRPARRALAAMGLLCLALGLAACGKKPKEDVAAESTAPPPAASPPPAAAPDPTPAATTAAPAPAPATGGGRKAGDSVNVRWKGKCYPAKIVNVPKPGTYFITYVGYSHSWDETVGENRICK